MTCSSINVDRGRPQLVVQKDGKKREKRVREREREQISTISAANLAA